MFHQLKLCTAKEASKRIVSDLLYTAGGGDSTSSNTEDPVTGRFDEYEEHSPSVVRRAEGFGEDTF